MSLKTLESKGVLQTLLFLLEKGNKVKVTDIDINASSSTLYRALTTLSKLQLIEEERQPPFTRYLKLTPKGETIAKHLKEINQTLKA
jgi:DNA-binding MarR family transcriptional regulator